MVGLFLCQWLCQAGEHTFPCPCPHIPSTGHHWPIRQQPGHPAPVQHQRLVTPPKTPSSRRASHGRDTPSLATSGKPSSMGFGLVLSEWCDTKCRWNVSHLHRPNRVACRDGRRKIIKPICYTKNDRKRENIAPERKSVKKFVSLLPK